MSAPIDLSTLPAVAALLPHEAPMILIDEVVDLTDETLTCRARVHADSPFASDGRVPALVALEYMAQAIAVQRGIIGFLRGLPISRGLLVACRALELHVDDFSPGDVLMIISAPHSEFGGFASYTARVLRDGALCAAAVVQVADMPEETPP